MGFIGSRELAISLVIGLILGTVVAIGPTVAALLGAGSACSAPVDTQHLASPPIRGAAAGGAT